MVSANLVIEVNVECPECETVFDILTETDLDDEGHISRQVLNDDRWKIPAEERLKCSPICPHCSVEFDVKGVNW